MPFINSLGILKSEAQETSDFTVLVFLEWYTLFCCFQPYYFLFTGAECSGRI